MKFQVNLNCIQNERKWEEHYRKFPRTEFSSLNEREKTWLRAFDETLRLLENKYSAIMDAKHYELQARVADPSDWLMDFNLDYVITLYLREDDPAYEEDDDNILMQIDNVYLEPAPDREWGLGFINLDHAEPGYYDDGKRCCYLYRQFYFYCDLDWRDLFRIDSLYVEIKIEEQSGMLPIVALSQTDL
jgi:hypothetical protein